MSIRLTVTLIFVICLMSSAPLSFGLQLSVIHINDFHARFEEMTPSMGTCKTTANCIGGFSRMYTLITQLYRTRPNPISLNAGDNFQGTLWYNMFKWNVTQFFLNMLPTDAMTLGNHEFDDGLEGIVPFLRSINIPVVLSNIDDSLEPSIRNLYRKSIIIEREGKKIGVIGVLTSGTKDVSKTGKLLFLDEVESVNSEARRLLDQEGVFTVIVVSHCGFESEIKMAKRVTRGISLIVGGHSNTLLYNGEPPIGVATGKYPTVIESVNNHTVLIIQADCFARYVGNLSVEYDASGNVISWEGNPIYLDQNIPKNESVEIHLDYYRQQINRISNRVLAKTNVLLDHVSCLSSECNLGNLIADSMIAYYSNQSDKDSWSKTAVAIINSGAIRSSISKGDITLKDLQNSLPFEDKLVYGELQGKHIKTVMERIN
ncbi:5prime-nucleotidase, C-terminal domain [Popillia japonica]|uniref:apyrase n=1 Tax=Popillia japonica TaxID=7064 RepID=A0AAW1K0I0_POPJA